MRGAGMRRISLVLPSYNSVKYLRRVIDAFLAQNYENKRLIIVDGKSTDGSHDVIQTCLDMSMSSGEIVWLKKPDSGISSAINLAIAEIDEGDIWGYLGADDILLPGVLSRAAGLFELEPDTAGVYFDSYTLIPGRNAVLRRCPGSEFSLRSLLRYGTIAGLQNVYLDAALVKRYRFNEAARFSMDYELYLRLARDWHGPFFHCPEPSTINISDGNISSVHASKSTREALGYALAIGGFDVYLLIRAIRWRLGWLRRAIARKS